MFRWLKDKKKAKTEKKVKVEDDYGFRKKQIIVEETDNGHSVIIKDHETTIVYPQSFCRLFYRARMPTPVQNFRETSTHIYDEIPELLESEERIENEADLIKDTRNARDSHIDLNNAIEVGPYLIVPITSSQNAQKGDVEVLRRHNDTCCGQSLEIPNTAFRKVKCSDCDANRDAELWQQHLNGEIIKDAKVVLTRCVKSKANVRESSNVQNERHTTVLNNGSDLCSFKDGAHSDFRNFADSPSADSNSRTLTGTPDSSSRTPDTLSERSESCAIADDRFSNACSNPEVLSNDCFDKDAGTEKGTSNNKMSDPEKGAATKDGADGNETGYEYDLSTSGDSEQSRTSEQEDYELYLSKIESNLELKHNVRKLVQDIDSASENDNDRDETGEAETMTYVSSLSEYSSAASHISNLSADRSESDDSSGYYECFEENCLKRNCGKKEPCVTLARSASAPEDACSSAKSKHHVTSRRHPKVKLNTKSKSVHTHKNKYPFRGANDIYKALSDEDKELYKFPSSSTSSNGHSSRHGRGKTVLAPQPTPVYMDPYRGKSGRHNRLLGDLIRMNYDKQLFFH